MNADRDEGEGEGKGWGEGEGEHEDEVVRQMSKIVHNPVCSSLLISIVYNTLLSSPVSTIYKSVGHL